jgi:cob(I)alamin adenosyltransferase
MRIYTKTGDDGTTGLFGGARVRKDSVRVEAYGTVDELNSVIGVARAQGQSPEVDALLAKIQNDLLALGAELACVPGKEATLASAPIGAETIALLERALDQADAELPPLKNFVLPGGCMSSALLHQARTVCRRAERRVLAAVEGEAKRSEILIYLNRLGDLLFVLARRANQLDGVSDVLWAPRA